MTAETSGGDPIVIVAEAPVIPVAVEHPEAVGPIGRLGGWAAGHLRLIPTLLRVFGRHAWALPRWLGNVLPDIRFGHS